jgi:type II secretory pathway component GspD/PulD (secretin)
MPFSGRSRTHTGFSLIAGAMVGLLLASLSTAFGQAPPAAKGDKAAAPEKRLLFEMREKPWKEVFDWLSDQSGLPVIASKKPAGNFTFVAPRGADREPRQYTMREICDFLNEGLAGTATGQFVLIRRPGAFVLVPLSEPQGPLPRVSLDELRRRGKQEVVFVILPLHSLVAEEFRPQLEKMMGPSGKAMAIPNTNLLYLRDSVGNLLRVVAMVKEIEKNDHAEILVYACRYIKARAAEQTVKNILGDPRDLIPPNAAQNAPGGASSALPNGSQPQPEAAAPPLPRMHYVACDERTNTVLVSGPADKIAQARAVLEKLDVPQASRAGTEWAGQPFLKTYPVPAGNAEKLAKEIQKLADTMPGLRAAPVGNFSVMVWAEPEQHRQLATRLAGPQAGTRVTEAIPLNELKAAATARTLQGVFGSITSGAPSIEPDSARNALMVNGTTGQITDIKGVLVALGEGKHFSAGGLRVSATRTSILIRGTPNELAEVAEALKTVADGGRLLDGRMRILSLESGSAATVAEALQRLLPRMRKNAVKVIDPISGDEQVAGDWPAEKNPWREFFSGLDEAGGPQAADSRPNNKQEKKPAQEKPGTESLPPLSPRPPASGGEGGVRGEGLPVTIMPFGSKLIVISDDPQALAMVQELVRLLTQTRGGDGDFQVVKLKNGNAVQVAQALDELFNGAKRTKERIRVVADPGTNSLLIKASPIDLVTIRSILSKAIDGEVDSRAVPRTWVIGPLKNASAHEVARVVRDVYREFMNNNPASITFSGGPFGFFGTQAFGTALVPNVDQYGNPVGVTLSLGVDDPTNTLVLHCSELMYDEIRRLAARLDQAAAQSTRTVKVLSIRGVDPVLVQQAIDAIQGRRQLPPERAGTPGQPPNGTGGTVPDAANPASGQGLSPSAVPPTPPTGRAGRYPAGR